MQHFGTRNGETGYICYRCGAEQHWRPGHYGMMPLGPWLRDGTRAPLCWNIGDPRADPFWAGVSKQWVREVLRRAAQGAAQHDA